jgi:hypothetical protein
VFKQARAGERRKPTLDKAPLLVLTVAGNLAGPIDSPGDQMLNQHT